MSLSFGHPMPDEYWDWKLAELTGWTLEYIESLSVARFHQWLQIMDGKSKYHSNWKR